MHKNVRGQAKRVLVVGAVGDDPPCLAGMLCWRQTACSSSWKKMPLAPRTCAAGCRLMGSARRTVIGGDPSRMVYKLAGPFDVIFCSPAYLSLRPTLEKLLATDGVLITNGEP